MRRSRRGQSTVELALAAPLIVGLLLLTLQIGVFVSDQVNLQHYALEGQQWAILNPTATTGQIADHIKQQMCGQDPAGGGPFGPPSATGSRFCAQGPAGVPALQVQVVANGPISITSMNAPPSPEPGLLPGPTQQVMAALPNCLGYTLPVTPSSATVQFGGANPTQTFTVGPFNTNGSGSTPPQVVLSGLAYPPGTNGSPQFNPPAIGPGNTATFTITTTPQTAPGTYSMTISGTAPGCRHDPGPSDGGTAVTVTVLNPTIPTSASAPAISITGVGPNTVCVGVATPVTISGVNFQSGAAVNFGGATAPSVTFVNSTSLTASVPATLAAGVFNIVVTNPGGGTGSLNNALTVSGSCATPGTPSPTINACAGQSGNFQTLITITWYEPLLVPWISGTTPPYYTLKAQEVAFCQ
ncbi:MAG: IPT/TIG domain-containing protein [Candidatus Dormibacteria bacterium]